MCPNLFSSANTHRHHVQQHRLSMISAGVSLGLLMGIGAAVMTRSGVDIFPLAVVQAAPEQASKPAASQPQKVDAKSSSGGSGETIEQRQKEARKWINDWRARSDSTPSSGALEGRGVCMGVVHNPGGRGVGERQGMLPPGGGGGGDGQVD